MKIIKVPLEGLINILVDLYDNGADFIDISNDTESGTDVIKIIVKPEYISEEDEDDIKEKFIQSQYLSEEDLNELI